MSKNIMANRLNHLINVLDVQEERVKNFRKNPTWGSQIFACTKCDAERIYGHSAEMEPEVKNPLILCEGICKKPTIHIFQRVHLGREAGC